MTQKDLLHPDLKDNENFRHLFQVNCNHPESNNIGKNCVYKNPSCEIEWESFVIGSLQFNYAGELCYRIYFKGDTFGRCVHPAEITIIEEVAQ